MDLSLRPACRSQKGACRKGAIATNGSSKLPLRIFRDSRCMESERRNSDQASATRCFASGPLIRGTPLVARRSGRQNPMASGVWPNPLPRVPVHQRWQRARRTPRAQQSRPDLWNPNPGTDRRDSRQYRARLRELEQSAKNKNLGG